MTKRILVIEDTEDNRQIVRDLLESAGYELIEALDGLEGVAAAEREHPDLILMDIQLPGIDGYEALRLIRDDPRVGDVPVVAVTAFAMREDRERAAREGFDGYLGKPISVRALMAQVSEFLSNCRDHVS